jgi:serine/threonine protein kinase
MVDAGGAPIDRYVVTEHLSEGGMGQIFVGKKLGAGGFEMEVVLKQLLPEFTQQPEFLDLFIREAKLSGTLDHANIVHTIDFVSHSGEYFIVMEYLPGGDLRTLLKKAKRRGRRFSPAAAIRICREVLSALAYAHVKRDFDGNPLKLIHRDVSPSNILVSYSGEVKLTDFGIAKAATHNSLFYKVKGKIGYMSPEQAKSEALDHRSDLYSLAVCLYEALTGERLFVHAGLTTSADEIYSQPVPQISRKVPGLTPDLDAIMAKALALSPDKRYQTAGELQEALTRCAHRNGLLMSAPELAEELRAACGDFEQWRSDDDEEEAGLAPRARTEIYDVGDDDEDDDDLGLGPVSIHSIAARSSIERQSRPKTEMHRFAGVELTSIINLMDLEGSEGAKPLIDLNIGPRLDSGPRLIDSGPQVPPGLARGPQPAMTQLGMGVPNLDQMPTAPRSLPFPQDRQPGPPGPQRQQMPPLQMPPLAPRGQGPRRRASSSGRRRSSIRPWLVIAVILFLTGIVAIVVAMSGPDVPAVPSK